MNQNRRLYQKPSLKQVSLVPEEAVLEVCKNHLIAEGWAQGLPNCSWPAGVGGGNCRGVTGS